MVVILAFAANVLVAIAKTIAAVLTGSASLVAESAHSWADAGNEIFLLVADRRSRRSKDAAHPLGYGREAYVWSLFAAVGLFTVGAVLSIANGIEQMLDAEPAGDFIVGYIVLGVSFLLEGSSLFQSVRSARRTASGPRRRTLNYVVNGSNPTVRAVIAEDSAALIGLVLAGAGLALHQITGSAVYDAVGSILIGLLLGGVAVLLIDRNRRFLVGATPPAPLRLAAGRALLARPEIARVTYLHLEFVGPGSLYLVAAVDLTGDRPENEVARRLRNIEQQIERDVSLVSTAVLTLAVSDEPALTFD